jgi:hypothetical protein
MAVDSLTLVRKRIGDDKKTETETFALTDATTSVTLKFQNAGILNVYDRKKQSTALVLGTDYNFTSEAGVITLLYEPEESNLTVVYYYHAFTDAELNELITAYGVNGACVEAIRWLIADASRLHDYSRGATSESLSQIVKNLQGMLADYIKLGGLTAGNDGSGTGGVVISKRIHNAYRKKTDVPYDLSRDDSLSN